MVYFTTASRFSLQVAYIPSYLFQQGRIDQLIKLMIMKINKSSFIQAGFYDILRMVLFIYLCSDMFSVKILDRKSPHKSCLGYSNVGMSFVVDSLAYNKEYDELLTGGVGCLIRWSLGSVRNSGATSRPSVTLILLIDSLPF